ncbi:MAG: heme ABC transporter permease [Porticoccaceae bacterium]|jgi:heme exporter protein C|nr:heme ABC transporter permease [Porticoccaceae bacterium]MBT4210890.1 heme ABC transporter permease [Porticoccaceae bacterium]MBT4591178.1 heme ABC transporter permease [Porticoccaceae bacterium]MBT7751218.1 heme ABC transporter permease [Porticoccaceae bacterium]
MNWVWFYRLGSPLWFYQTTTRWLPWLGLLAFILLTIGLVWGLGFAPQDAKQGNSFRIIYMHVPASFLALAGYFLMATAGAIGLIWKMKLSYMVMKAAAPIGAALTFLALFTGAVWGKPTWGSYWVWDARITSMLILLFLYFGVLALQYAFHNEEASNKASAILALIGTVNIPIIYKSVDWWYTLHQPSTIKLTSAPSMHPDMFQPLLVMILGFYCFYIVALCLFTRVEILRRERKTGWVGDLVGELNGSTEGKRQ